MVTCRSGDYDRLRLGGFPTAMLRELEDDQIRQFAGRYLLGQAPEFLAQVLPGTRGPKDATSAIASLARNPYLLSAFIYLYQNNSAQALPDNTGVLFSRLARALWERERRRNRDVSGPAQASWPQFKAALARLARLMIEQDTGEDLPVSRAVEILGHDAVVAAAVDANLLVRNGEFIRFYHDLLRVYFIAESLAQADVPALDEWCRQHPSSWLSVAAAWSALSPEADAFLEQMQWQDAAEVMSRGYLAGNDARQKQVQRGIRELAQGYWAGFEPAIKALAEMGQAAVPALIAKLGEENAEMREKVTFVLGRIGSADAVDALIPLLDDPSPLIRGRVLTALEENGGQQALSALAERINDEAAEMRAAAVRAYAGLATPGAVGSVLPLADDPDVKVRRAAIESLGRLGDPSVAARLVGHASEEDPEIRAAAVAALGRLGGDEARGCAMAALRDPIAAVRVAGVAAAETLGSAAVPPLLEALRDEDHDVRLQAASTLGRLRDDRALEALLAALTDESASVRTEAARALGLLGDRARGPMLELLRGDDPALWETASQVLGRQGWTPVDVRDQVRFAVAGRHWGSCLAIGTEAVPQLRHLLQLADSSRRREVAETLRKLGWQPSERDPDLFRYHSALVNWDRQLSLSLADLLDLRAWLGPAEPGGKPVLEQAEKMLGQLAHRPGDEPLMKAFEEGPETVRYFATVTAGRAQCQAAMMPILINLVSLHLSFPGQPDAARIICAQALAQIGDQSIIPALIEHAGSDPEPGPYVGKAGPLAAIQAAARLAGLPRLFEAIPATALGKAGSGADPKEPFDLWQLFGLAESATLEQASVAVVLNTIGEFDKSKLPSWSPIFSETAMWELHQRMGVLTLTLLPAATEVFLRRSLVDAAMRSMGPLAAVPVLRQVAQWGGPELTELANAQLVRMLGDQG
jgi:HEAT repeat protein